jgi:hypothetical protein
MIPGIAVPEAELFVNLVGSTLVVEIPGQFITDPEITEFYGKGILIIPFNGHRCC